MILFSTFLETHIKIGLSMSLRRFVNLKFIHKFLPFFSDTVNVSFTMKIKEVFIFFLLRYYVFISFFHFS